MQLKNTKSRNLILNFLKQQDVPVTANDIFQNLIDEKITLSTIYRTLEKFTNQKIIKKEVDKNGTALFFLPQNQHCHILECKKCHNQIKLKYCPYENINKKIKHDTNFQVDEENIVIYGICNSCNKKQENN